MTGTRTGHAGAARAAVFALALLALPIVAWAGQPDIAGGDPRTTGATAPVAAAQARADAQTLFREVMSPFCPGLTLADCPSPAAFDLRNEIDARLQRGESRQAILDGLVATYGPQLLADPSGTALGRVVWGVPMVLSIVAALAVAMFVRRATHAPVPAPDDALPPADRHRLDEELAAFD